MYSEMLVLDAFLLLGLHAPCILGSWSNTGSCFAPWDLIFAGVLLHEAGYPETDHNFDSDRYRCRYMLTRPLEKSRWPNISDWSVLFLTNPQIDVVDDSFQLVVSLICALFFPNNRYPCLESSLLCTFYQILNVGIRRLLFFSSSWDLLYWSDLSLQVIVEVLSLVDSWRTRSSDVDWNHRNNM
jgi:hypothetical protein